MGCSQSEISRYERGIVAIPPARAERVMHRLHDEGAGPTVEDLADEIHRRLSGPDSGHLRRAVYDLLRALPD